MKEFFIVYSSLAVSMLAIDAVWLTLMASRFYQKYIGSLLAETPNLIAAGVFYFVYIAGVAYFVVMPLIASGTYGKAFIAGAFFGFVAYATYDLTNQATLREWSTVVTVVDLAWGALLTGTISCIALYAVRMFA